MKQGCVGLPSLIALLAFGVIGCTTAPPNVASPNASRAAPTSTADPNAGLVEAARAYTARAGFVLAPSGDPIVEMSARLR